MSLPQEITIRSGKIVQAGGDADLTDTLRGAAERSLYIFTKVICGRTRLVQHLHLPLCNWLQTIPPRRRVLLTPRGTFKTTMALSMGMHMTVQQAATNCYFPGRKGSNLRILYAAENMNRALARIGWIRRQYMNNHLLKALWPDLCWNDPNTESPMWTTSRFMLRRTEDFPEGTFEAAGVDSGSTGGHYDAIVKDDLIGLNSRKKPMLMAAAIEWWKTSHSLCDDEETLLDYVFGTRWASEDLYTWIEENETAYESRVLSCYKRDGSLLFPERLSRERLEYERRTKGELYYLNYENKAIGGGTTAFNMDYCGKFTMDVVAPAGTLTFSSATKTNAILELIEGANRVPQRQPKPKPFWKQTGDERTATWLEMQRNWSRDRFGRMEVS